MCRALGQFVCSKGGNNPCMGDGLRAPSFAVASPGNMSQWGDQHEEEFHDAEKVGSKRPRGSRGPEGKLAQKAHTLRRRAERAEGDLNAEQPRYRLGAMTEQSFDWCYAGWCQNGTSTTPGRPSVAGSRDAPGRGMQWHESSLLRRARTKPNATFTSSAMSCVWHHESG